jgi:hypothetical protein
MGSKATQPSIVSLVTIYRNIWLGSLLSNVSGHKENTRDFSITRGTTRLTRKLNFMGNLGKLYFSTFEALIPVMDYY